MHVVAVSPIGLFSVCLICVLLGSQVGILTLHQQSSAITTTQPVTILDREVSILPLLTTTTTTFSTSPSSSDKNDNDESDDNTASNYNLAYKESYGFFTDIPNEDWVRKQHIARTMPSHINNNKYQDANFPSPAMYYMNHYEPKFACNFVQRVGGMGDGPKWTCDPHRLLSKPNCLIYSVGSAGKFEWEDGLVQLGLGTHCDIHVFDPSGDYSEHVKLGSRNFTFHKWGLKSSYAEFNYPRRRWTMKTLEETIQELGHENQTIDIFKVDCEFCEWYSYKDWLNTSIVVSIGQILMETHNLPTKKWIDTWQQLPLPENTEQEPFALFEAFEEAGFILFSKEPNIHPFAKGEGVEWSYIKLHPDFMKENETDENSTLLFSTSL